MDKNKEKSSKLKKISLKVLIPALLAAAALLQAWDKLIFPIPNMHSWILSNLKPSTYTTVSILLIFLLLILSYLVLIAYLNCKSELSTTKKKLEKEHENEEKLYELFGVKWNEQYKLRCLKCKSPLKNDSHKDKSYVFHCSNCNLKHSLRDINGVHLTESEAVEKLKINIHFINTIINPSLASAIGNAFSSNK